jgi:two-component system NtrC family sensor kinase
MVWITLLIVLLAMLATSVVVRVAIRPIRALVFATGRVAAGDYDSRVDDRRNDEIGDLATSFNKMLADLKDSRGALVEKELLESAIVELKDTQQQLVQAGKMAAIGQLAAGVAHEINNPLAGIMGYAQLANEQLRTRSEVGISADEIQKFSGYVENMEKQSQRCKQIVQNLLRFARSSTIEETEQVDVTEVLNETLSFISHQTATRQINLTTNLRDDLPPINGHAGKLQQVFTNIIINAIQAIKSSGNVNISSTLVDGEICVVISDTGEGIPSENLEKIFDPFFTTKEIGQGTGLGLSVTYGLIRDMGGKIEVDSTVGVGTTFTLTFPQGISPVTHPQHFINTQPIDVKDSPTHTEDSPSA